MSPLSSGQGKEEKGKGEGGGGGPRTDLPINPPGPRRTKSQASAWVNGSQWWAKVHHCFFFVDHEDPGCLGVVHDAEGYQQMVPGVGGNMCCGGVVGNVGT